MENRLMDKYEVASYIGGISPKMADKLMRSMPCVNVGGGVQRQRRRVFKSDLDAWMYNRRTVQADSPGRGRSKKVCPVSADREGLDENGLVLKRRPKAR